MQWWCWRHGWRGSWGAGRARRASWEAWARAKQSLSGWRMELAVSAVCWSTQVERSGAALVSGAGAGGITTAGNSCAAAAKKARSQSCVGALRWSRSQAAI